MANKKRNTGADTTPVVSAELQPFVKSICAMLTGQPKEIQAKVIGEVQRLLDLEVVGPAPSPKVVQFTNVMTTKELAAHLRCSVATISRRMANGELEYVKDGSKVLFTPREIDKYIAQRRTNRRRQTSGSGIPR